MISTLLVSLVGLCATASAIFCASQCDRCPPNHICVESRGLCFDFGQGNRATIGHRVSCMYSSPDTFDTGNPLEGERKFGGDWAGRVFRV